MKKIMNCCGNRSLGVLIIRLGLALVFITHGWAKFADMGSTIGFFASLGVPAFMAYVVAAVELFGGIAMLLGIFVFSAGILLSTVMVFAILLVKAKMGLQKAEIDIMLLVASLGVALIGAGKWSRSSQKNVCGSDCDTCDEKCACKC